MRTFNKDAQLWFKALPVTEDSRPDAVYIRYKGEVPGHEVHEIWWKSEKWTVPDEALLTPSQALLKTAERYRDEIDKVKKPGMKREYIAMALGISEGTLRKRLAMIRNHISQGTVQ